ncbi:MAG: aldehyde dehydrogenase family protein, partial [Bacteroidetes bacterium]
MKPSAVPQSTLTDFPALFQQHRAHAPQVAQRDAKARATVIKRMIDYARAHESELQQAMMADFRKAPAEVLLTELLPFVQEANFVRRQLPRWIKPQRVPTPLPLAGTSSYIRREPKGTVLIISPWNYPFLLTMSPLVSAIAAGNTVIIKPSEMTPHTSAFMRKMVEALFPVEEVAVCEGDATVAQALLDLPFNHVFFTGSPRVGKIVMRAAAQHLTPVTLELGGKSPAIIDASADLTQAAQKIAWGKSVNMGQTCISPDYVLVPEAQAETFVQAYAQALQSMYGPEPAESPDYCRLINDRNFARVHGLLEDALAQGATARIGGEADPTQRYIAPTLLTGVNKEMAIMQEEIFGPILPVLTYRDPAEVLQTMAGLPRPLAMYVFARDTSRIEYYLNQSISGDVLINDCLLHFAHSHLPFGGINNSGIGKSHGYAGFKEFSHERSVMVQKLGLTKVLYPPYRESLMQWVRRFMP